MDQALSIFTNKGNRIWNMKQPACITTMEAIFLERQGLHIVAVALNNKQIIFYNVSFSNQHSYTNCNVIIDRELNLLSDSKSKSLSAGQI